MDDADNLSWLLQLEGAAGISAAEAAGLIILAAGHGSSTLCVLCQLPAAGDVCLPAVLQALKAATGVGNADSLSRLLELDGAAGISTTDVAELMILAVGQGSNMLRLLCQLPAAGDVDSAAVVQTLKATVEIGNADSLSWLVKLEGAAGISPVEVAELIDTALGSTHRSAVGVQASTEQVFRAAFDAPINPGFAKFQAGVLLVPAEGGMQHSCG